MRTDGMTRWEKEEMDRARIRAETLAGIPSVAGKPHYFGSPREIKAAGKIPFVPHSGIEDRR